MSTENRRLGTPVHHETGKSRKEKSSKGNHPLRSEIISWLQILLAAACIAFVLNTFIIANSRVPSGSMENTIMTGDRIFGNRLAYVLGDPQRFDIVIFRYPDDESQLFIKRIIGLPGETVEITDGKVYIDGSETPLDDSFTPETPTGNYGPYTVPENCYFMLGDNRNNSKDSRFWQNTFVERDAILGKAVLKYFPGIKFLE